MILHVPTNSRPLLKLWACKALSASFGCAGSETKAEIAKIINRTARSTTFPSSHRFSFTASIHASGDGNIRATSVRKSQFDRRNRLCSDHGQTFPNVVRKELPTMRPRAIKNETSGLIARKPLRVGDPIPSTRAATHDWRS